MKFTDKNHTLEIVFENDDSWEEMELARKGFSLIKSFVDMSKSKTTEG